MGLLLGKIDGNTMVVMDSFALPVEGTETRVNAQAAAYEYMTEYIEAAKRVGTEGEGREGSRERRRQVCVCVRVCVCRWDTWRMPLAGTTVTLAMAAGSLAST